MEYVNNQNYLAAIWTEKKKKVTFKKVTFTSLHLVLCNQNNICKLEGFTKFLFAEERKKVLPIAF